MSKKSMTTSCSSTLLVLLLGLFWSGLAEADGTIANLGLYYAQYTVAKPDTTSAGGGVWPAYANTTTTTDIDLVLGYRFGEGAFVGLQYLQQGVVFSSQNDTNSNASSTMAWAVGPSVGFMEQKGGFACVVSYLLTANYTANINVGPDVPSLRYKLTGTSGYGLGAGYLFSAGSFRLGPWLEYESVTYSKKTGATTSFSSYSPGQSTVSLESYSPETVTTVQPMIVLSVDF